MKKKVWVFMKISEQAVRHLIGSMLLESLLKEDEGEIPYTIPNLPKGYATLHALLKARKVTGDRMASVKSLRDFFGEKFLFKGDKIYISDITDPNAGQPKILSYKDHTKDVFDKRGTVTAVLKMIKDARAKKKKINIGDDIKKQVFAQVKAGVEEEQEQSASAETKPASEPVETKPASEPVETKPASEPVETPTPAFAGGAVAVAKEVAELSLEEQVKLLPDKAKFETFISTPDNIKLYIRDEGGDETKFQLLCNALNELLKIIKVLDKDKLSAAFSDTLVKNTIGTEADDSKYLEGFIMNGKFKICCFKFNDHSKIKESIKKDINDLITNKGIIDPKNKATIITKLKEINNIDRDLISTCAKDEVYIYFKIKKENHDLLNVGFDNVKKYSADDKWVFGWDIGPAVAELLKNLDGLATALDPTTFDGQASNKIVDEGVGNDRLLRGYIRGVLRS